MAYPVASLDIYTECPHCKQPALVLDAFIDGVDRPVSQCIHCGVTAGHYIPDKEIVTPNHGNITVLTPYFEASSPVAGTPPGHRRSPAKGMGLADTPAVTDYL